MEKLKVELEPGTHLPDYATEGSVGLDIRAMSLKKIYSGTREVEKEKLEILQKGFLEKGTFHIRGNERVLIGTGIKLEVPQGYCLDVRPKSGISLKRGIDVILGTVDIDYRGEVGVIVANNSNYARVINLHEEIAQLVFLQVGIPKVIEVVTDLSETARGEGGFGHSYEK